MKPITYCMPVPTESAEARRETLRTYADNGISHIVLSSTLLEHFMVVPDDIAAFETDMRDCGISFMDAHAPWGTWKDPGVPVEAQHELIVLRHRMALHICNHFGVTSIAYHTANTFNHIYGKHLVIDDYYQMLIRSMTELLPDAERHGVVMALENQWTPLNQSAYLLKAAQYFNSQWVGICYDAGHGNLTEHGNEFPEQTCVPGIWQDIGLPVVWEEQFIEKVRPYIVNCHLHDNNGIIDQHNLPGNGTVDWKRIMAILANSPRLQCIQSEVSMGKTGAPSIPELVKSFSDLLDLNP